MRFLNRALIRTSIRAEQAAPSLRPAASASPKGDNRLHINLGRGLSPRSPTIRYTTLVIHGLADRILPIPPTAHRIRVCQGKQGTGDRIWATRDHLDPRRKSLTRTLAFLGDPHRKSQVA